MNVGVFGVDPGGSSGLAWGIFNPDERDIGEQLRTRLSSGSATVKGDERTQIREITSIWQAFYRACVHSALLPPDRVWFVCEDFVLKPGETAGGKDSTSPVALIWGIEGYRMGQVDQARLQRRGHVAMPPMILQMAGQAKSYATGVRLKEWNCWVVGREHERSAFAHVALFLKRYQAQGLK